MLPGEESEQNSINNFWSVLRSVNLEATSLESVISLDTKILNSLNSNIRLAELVDLLKSDGGKQNEFENVDADDAAVQVFCRSFYSFKANLFIE